MYKRQSLKVISGLISKKNPDALTVEVPEGTLGSRGTEFQTMVSKGRTDTLLIGPGKNNTLGMRPGAVLVGNKLGSTLLDNPYSMVSMREDRAPGQAQKITKNQLKNLGMKKNVCSKSAFIADYAYQPVPHTFQMERRWIHLVDVYI